MSYVRPLAPQLLRGLFYFCYSFPFAGKGPFINDVTQVGGRGLGDFVTLCMMVQVKYPFYRDRGERGVNFGSKLRDVIYVTSFFSTLYYVTSD